MNKFLISKKTVVCVAVMAMVSTMVPQSVGAYDADLAEVASGLSQKGEVRKGVPQDKLTVHDRKIDKLISKMTLEEKIEMLHSKTNMSSEGVPRLGIQDIKYTDGPFGIREENGDGFRPMGWTTDSATYFPTGSALAATWSEDIAYKYGVGMGREARLRGKDIILGPAINIQRLPVGGRSYEYLSEDPVLSAALTVGYTKGVQDAGTAVCLKHFALNNQETNRSGVDVNIDERAMREIYLKPFEKGVMDGGAMSVMPAYNKIGGVYCSENDMLLNKILRDEWGFKGMTVSDWGGTHSTVGAAFGGLDVQMPGDNFFGKALLDSVKAGIVPESVIDEKVRHILRLRYAVEAIPEAKANVGKTSLPEQQRTAYEVATKSIVLLKNEGRLLPISPSVRKIAVIGRNAVATTAAGGIGAGVKTPYEVTPLQGLRNAAGEKVEITFVEGYKDYTGPFGRRGAGANPKVALSTSEHADPELLVEAIKAAAGADLVIFICGTNKWIESEGYDRSDIKLPVGQEEIVAAISAVNPNIVSVVISGGPCDLQVLEKYSPAIVQGWWNGMEGGNALAAVLFGSIAPSGKLPFTFPVKLEDSPAFALGVFPPKASAQADLFTTRYRQDLTGGASGEEAKPVAPTSDYTEGMFVGYRWFDIKNLPVMYAFGHGLSYVDFEYTGISADKASYGAGDVISLSFDLTNHGEMEADEVAQLYVHRAGGAGVSVGADPFGATGSDIVSANADVGSDSAGGGLGDVEYPVKELKAFKRVSLSAGETKHVILSIPVSELRYWNSSVGAWMLSAGVLELMLGSASDDIRATCSVEIK